MYSLPHKTHHVHHPAYIWWFVTIIFVALIVLFGFISVFIPWAVKDLAVAQRAWAYPFKTCIQNTFSTTNEETCIDNDFITPQGVPLTGANAECKAYILSTIAWVFISVLLGVVLLILIGYILEHLWWSPMVIAYIVDISLFIVSAACFLAWIMFLVYMQLTCAPNSIFPISPGFSYGWIMYLFNSVFSLVAIVTAIFGTLKMKQYQREEEEEAALKKEEMSTPLRPVYPEVPSSPYANLTMASPAGSAVMSPYYIG